MTAGIYCIENLIDKRKYIGKDSKIPIRWEKYHKPALDKSKHSNKYIQNAWNKYGEENFRFYILIKLPKFDLLLNLFEKFFIRILKTHITKNGYNMTFGGEGVSGLKMSSETKNKMSVSRKKRIISEETKQKISKSLSGENSPFFGRLLSEETKQKIGNGNRGKILSDETKSKISKNHSHYRRPFTDDEKRIKAESKRGIKVKNSSSIYVGVTYKKNGWESYITINKKQIYLGRFKEEYLAAEKYDIEAIRNFGKNANINFESKRKEYLALVCE